MPDDSGALDRLDSWKEIAAYLRRDVRTVQRWEQTDGLPVHRHKRAHRPIPYAYKSELDAWWTNRSDNASAPLAAQAVAPGSRRVFLVAVIALLAVSLAAIGYALAARERARTDAVQAARRASDTGTPLKSIAVLPFLDLSEGMRNEEFADGITEELIDRLTRIPGLQVPAPTSSFYFKNKHLPVPEIGKALHVAFVLDGSVRKSGPRVRVAARLIRAENATVVWSETYDRPWNDILVVQDDIADEVTRSLTSSIGGGAGG